MYCLQQKPFVKGLTKKDIYHILIDALKTSMKNIVDILADDIGINSKLPGILNHDEYIDIFSKLIENRYIDIIKRLKSTLDSIPKVYRNVLVKSVTESRLGFIKLMIAEKIFPADFYDNFFIRWASEGGHIEVVKLLLQDKRVDPSADNNYAIQSALANGRTEIVKLLLQNNHVDPSLLYNLKKDVTTVVTPFLKDVTKM